MNTQTRLDWDAFLRVPPGELPERSLVPIQIFDAEDALFEEVARKVIDLVRQNNDKGLPTRIAWPVGPKKNYPLMLRMTEEENLSWKNTYHFQVDEWLDWQGRKLPADHPFNLESWLRREFFNKLPPELAPAEENLFFHDPLHLDKVDKAIVELGGIDILLGGFGFTGHIAFNEPLTCRWNKVTPEEYCNGSSHILHINDETFIAHSQRSTGGNTRIIPPCAITIGFKQILGAKKIVLVSDGGAWKQTILRVMCFHEPTVEFPCTFVQNHPDTVILVDQKTAACPPMDFGG